MSDDPRPPFGAQYPPPTPPSPPPPAMPPLGPPYVTQPGPPPSPQFPPAPPPEWPATPAMIPAPIPAAPQGSVWTDRLKHPAVLWGAVAIVLAVVAGALVGRATSDDGARTASPRTTLPRRPSTTAPPTTSSSSSEPTTTTTSPQDLESVVNDIERFVERERGLTFKNKVDVHLAGEGEFQDRLLKDFDEERPALLEQQEVLTALGLLPPGTDVVAESKSLLEIGVVGFYDPKTKQLVVRGTSITPYVREVLAHELTHALDDQYFDLNRPELDNVDDETGFGFLALTEGDARRVEDAYVASLTQAEQRQALQEEQELIAQHPEVFTLPPILITLLQAPYEEGEPFVGHVVDTGGQAAVNQAFQTPPTTSEQILDPQKFTAGEGAVDVPPPTPDGKVSNVGVLGELLLREMLTGGLGFGNGNDQAVAGWGGDKYVTWKDASGASCLRDTFVGDTPTDTAELVDALTQWANDHDGSVSGGSGGPASLTVCAG